MRKETVIHAPSCVTNHGRGCADSSTPLRRSHLDVMRRFSRRAWWLHLVLLLAVVVPPQTGSSYWTVNTDTRLV